MTEKSEPVEVKQSKKNPKFGNLPGPGPGRPLGSKNKIDEMLKNFMQDCFEIWEEIEGKKKLIAYLKKNPRFIPRFAAMLQGFAPRTFLAEIGIEARPIVQMPEMKLRGGASAKFLVGDPPELPGPEGVE